MGKNKKIRWRAEPEPHNYPAAESYLSLIYDAPSARRLVQQLRRARVSTFKSKDIFRASGLSLLGVSNSHLQRDREKIREGEKLSPLLLVRHPALGKMIVADGYHRLCAVYSFDEDAEIPCKIV
ncbi:MAG TPA: hypothetical protein VMI74_00050 [Burkholderiales bacterium]|nr:hypothetical protein [Burkholderiales bacterium]